MVTKTLDSGPQRQRTSKANAPKERRLESNQRHLNPIILNNRPKSGQEAVREIELALNSMLYQLSYAVRFIILTQRGFTNFAQGRNTAGADLILGEVVCRRINSCVLLGKALQMCATEK